MWKSDMFPEGTAIIRYGEKSVLVFECQHDAHPKTLDTADPGAISPVKAGQTCDFWSPKNDYAKYSGYPQVCFNCFHSTAIEITEYDES